MVDSKLRGGLKGDLKGKGKAVAGVGGGVAGGTFGMTRAELDARRKTANEQEALYNLVGALPPPAPPHT